MTATPHSDALTHRDRYHRDRYIASQQQQAAADFKKASIENAEHKAPAFLKIAALEFGVFTLAAMAMMMFSPLAAPAVMHIFLISLVTITLGLLGKACNHFAKKTENKFAKRALQILGAGFSAASLATLLASTGFLGPHGLGMFFQHVAPNLVSSLQGIPGMAAPFFVIKSGFAGLANYFFPKINDPNFDSKTQQNKSSARMVNLISGVLSLVIGAMGINTTAVTASPEWAKDFLQGTGHFINGMLDNSIVKVGLFLGVVSTTKSIIDGLMSKEPTREEYFKKLNAEEQKIFLEMNVEEQKNKIKQAHEQKKESFINLLPYTGLFVLFLLKQTADIDIAPWLDKVLPGTIHAIDDSLKTIGNLLAPYAKDVIATLHLAPANLNHIKSSFAHCASVVLSPIGNGVSNFFSPITNFFDGAGNFISKNKKAIVLGTMGTVAILWTAKHVFSKNETKARRQESTARSLRAPALALA